MTDEPDSVRDQRPADPELADLTDQQVGELLNRIGPDVPTLTRLMVNLAKRQRHIE